MTGSRTLGIVNVNVIIAKCYSIIKLTAGKEIVNGQNILADQLAALADTNVRCNGRKLGIFAALKVVFEELNHLHNLFSCLDLCL